MRLASEPRLSPLQPRRDSWSQRLIRWHTAAPRANESVRWESIDGAFIAISLGEGDELGCAVVAGSDGRRAVVESYEEALVVAETWRT
jgi:hypothetical protein